jgi:molybdopterin-containing oxidoreductase family iron-sulfur binding subunit
MQGFMRLSLYDNMRLKSPKIAGKDGSWSTVDAKIKSSIADAKAKGGVVLLTNTLASPSTEKLIADFITQHLMLSMLFMMLLF